jgi:tetratricopeptide (TPR) repeat protein
VTEPDWQDLLREASRLRAGGRVDEAIAAYKRVLAAEPDLPNSWYNLGLLQRQARAFDQALDAYQRALDLGITEPEEVHLNRAVIYADFLQQPELAERELRQALEKNPDYVPALLNAGNLHEDMGQREEARAAYERALAIEPDNATALARLAGVSQSPELDDALAQRLRSAVNRKGISPADRASLQFALAALLDAARRYDDAFEAARAANDGSRSAATYDRAAHEHLVDRLIHTFDRTADSVDPAEPSPVFICGMFRSGSTLVEQILAAHSRVAAAGELDLIPALVGRIPGYPEAVRSANPQAIAGWREFYLGGLPFRPTAERLVTDKRPDNFLHIGLIKTLFPTAKIVHTRRDPLDNLLSLYFLHLDPGLAYALHLDDAAHWYCEYRRLMAHWRALYSEDIFNVDYDLLVSEPREQIAPLLEFLGLGWEDRVFDFHRNRSPVRTASVWQVRQPLHGRSSGRWRNYEKHLESLKRALSDSRT